MKKIAIAFLVLIFTCVNIFSQNAAPNETESFIMQKNFSFKKNIILQEKPFCFILKEDLYQQMICFIII